MDNLNFQNEISRKIIKNSNKYIEDADLVDKKVKESKAIYKGKPVPYLYIPRIFQEKDIERIEELT